MRICSRLAWRRVRSCRSSRAGSAAGREGDELELDLVGDDEMEENLAVTNMVQKIETGCTQELGMLDRRMGYLLGDEALEGHAARHVPKQRAYARGEEELLHILIFVMSTSVKTCQLDPARCPSQRIV